MGKRKLTEEDIINIQYEEMMRYENLTPFQKFKDDVIHFTKATFFILMLIVVIGTILHLLTYSESEHSKVKSIVKGTNLYLDENRTSQSVKGDKK